MQARGELGLNPDDLAEVTNMPMPTCHREPAGLLIVSLLRADRWGLKEAEFCFSKFDSIARCTFTPINSFCDGKFSAKNSLTLTNLKPFTRELHHFTLGPVSTQISTLADAVSFKYWSAVSVSCLEARSVKRLPHSCQEEMFLLSTFMPSIPSNED